MNTSYQILIQKLDQFIKRYYLYKILRGFFISLALFLLFFLIESLIEYFHYTSVFFRTFLFFSTLLLLVVLLVYYILVPVLALFKIGKFINHKQAADIIQYHFPQIKDKLLNTLELGEKINSEKQNLLLLASIEQRTSELNLLAFKIALPYKSLKTSFYYFISGLFLLSIVFVLSPSVFSEALYRIIDYNTVYHKPAPFEFEFKNYNQYIKRGESLSVVLSIKGSYLPDKVYISIGNNLFLMEKNRLKRNIFKFDIQNLNNDITLFFSADGYRSQSYFVKVLPAPVLKDFVVEVYPPAYTGIAKYSLHNSGDLNIPYGSKIKWLFSANYTDSIFLIFDSVPKLCSREGEDFVFVKRFLKSYDYSMSLSNFYFKESNNITYQISVIPDLYPDINMQMIEDSTHISSFYYILKLSDDYGFSKLNFNYRIINNSDTSALISRPIELVKNLKTQDVFYYFDFSKIQLPLSESFIQYYFEIFDNDFISGYKSSKTPFQVYKPLGLEQQKIIIDEYRQRTDDYIEQAKKLNEELKKDIQNFKRKDLNQQLTEWDKKNFVKNLINKQNKLNTVLEKIKQENLKKNNFDNQLYKKNQELLKKQKEIQNILDELMDDELKQLLKELEELQNKFNDKQFEKLRNKLDLSYYDLDKNLDKTLELLKRFRVEEKMQHLSDDLEKLSERQEELINKNYKKSGSFQKKKEQESIKNSLELIKKDFHELLKLNSELKSPYKIENLDKDFKDIHQNLDQINKDIEKKSSKKIKQSQQKTSDELRALSKKIENMLNDMNSMSMNMNMEDLRQIIENLSEFSFAQEDIYVQLQSTYAIDPLFNQLMKSQNKLQNDFLIIRDSLNSLSTRLIQMSQIINKELKTINYSMKTALNEFQQLHRRAVMRHQRSIINSTNILALYLDELSDQLQQQMAKGGSGKGKQSKSNQQMQKLKQQQQNLKQQLEQLLEELKKSGGKKNAKVNESIVKTLAEQEIFNKMLKDLQNSQGISPEGMQKLKEIKNISDQNINDLINKNITKELLNRNQQIKTRLLEAENAQRKREKEEIRESQQGKDILRKFPDEIEQLFKQKHKYKETLQKFNLDLNLFYKNLSKEYYQRIK